MQQKLRRSILPLLGLVSVTIHVRTWWKTGWWV
jgi:hypothetical protein